MWENMFMEALDNGSDTCAKFIIENKYLKDDKIIDLLILYNNVKLLQYMHKGGNEISQEMIKRAIENDSIDCLKYLCTNCEISCEIFKLVIEERDVRYLKCICESNKFPIEKIAELSIEKNNLQYLQYLHKNGCVMTQDLGNCAIKHKSTACLEYIVANS